jgi:hypothetical protein
MNAEYLHKVKADLVAAIIRSDDSMDKIIRRIARDQRNACERNVRTFDTGISGEVLIGDVIEAILNAEINEK